MDADTATALVTVNARLSALEANAASTNAGVAATAMAQAQANSSLIAEESAYQQAARLAALSAAVHPGFIPNPAWPGTGPYPGHPGWPH